MLASVLLFALSLRGASAQFSPDGGQPGSIAVHVDSARWLGWAVGGTVAPGWLDVADTTLGRVAATGVAAALGPEDSQLVSLGDGGSAEIFFEPPIRDGVGADFAVFENGFAVSDTAGFFELAFVEVSSDGVHFARFPATSLTADPVPAFGTLDSRSLDGLAGRFSAPYGVPFDLADLPRDARVDVRRVTHVRLVDVVGTPDTAFAKTDADGAIVYDPYPTPFPGGGFDLDAIGVLNAANASSTVQPTAGGIGSDGSGERAPRTAIVVRAGELPSFLRKRPGATLVDLTGRAVPPAALLSVRGAWFVLPAGVPSTKSISVYVVD